MRLNSSLRRFYLMALVATGLLVVSAVLPYMAYAEDGPSIEELRERIKENGWSFEVDDSYVGTHTYDEIQNLKGLVVPENYSEEYKANLKIYPIDKDFPTSMDWRDVEGVTPVKNQADCGACWAFAAVGQLEAHIKIHYGVEVDLSEQQCVSCNPYGADCDGGWASSAYWVMSNQGMVLEGCMPYLGLNPPQAPCIQSGVEKYGYVTGYHNVANDVDQIKAALQDGPVWTGVDASSEFDAYSSGCYDVAGHSVNHAVLIVGYDDRGCSDQGYWIVKNSWGPDFGDGGYIYVKYGAGMVGYFVSQLHYSPPATNVSVYSTLSDSVLIAGHEVEINWSTSGTATDNVDLYLSVDGGCYDIPVGNDVPNTGSFMWTVENWSTDRGRIVIHPSGAGSEGGYGFSSGWISILGSAIRYVSPAGSNIPPYDSPAKAAWELSDALYACTGLDSIMVCGGDFTGPLNVSKPAKIFGGFSNDFSVRDNGLYETRIQSGNSGMRFLAGSGKYGGVDGVTFHNCVGGGFSEPVNGDHGGGIFVYESSPIVNNCLFENNRAAWSIDTGYGGAICVVRGSPIISNCDFTGNIATKGGAVSVTGPGTVYMDNCTFMANSCSDSMEINLGACFYLEDEGSLIFSDGLIRNNGGSGRGGAVSMSNSSVEMTRVDIENNRARLDGGGFYGVDGELTLSNLKISGNSAATGSGGGINVDACALSVKNVHISDNSSSILGGGLVSFGCTGGIENSLVDGNTASTCGGLLMVSDEPFLIRNNVVTENTGGVMLPSANTVNDYNCVINNIGADYLSGTPGEHSISLDPMFADPDNGDFALGVYSPCIDAGDVDPACDDPDGSRSDIGLLGGPTSDFVAPASVAGAHVTDLGGGEVRLDWAANAESGITQYVVYRDTAAVFVPSAGKVVGTVDHPGTSLTDSPVDEGTYYLVVAVDDLNHSGGYSVRVNASGGSSPANGDALPTALAFDGVVPNPFNPMTQISYEVPTASRIQVVVYDVRGRMVRDLLDGHVEAGYHKVTWDGRDDRGQSSAAGVYFARIANGKNSDTVKMVLAK